jgi:8-oxo-dGTP diphosphatase
MVRVTCAIIEFEGKVLVTQRSSTMSLPLLWEFPGGKIEKGESEEESLIREIKEELAIDIRIKRKITPCEYQYGTKSILLIPFICDFCGGTITLIEHAQFIWSEIEELKTYNWAPADLPIVQEFTTLKYEGRNI